MKTIRLLLGDQLNINHSWFAKVDDQIVYCMFEMRQETDYVQHHVQKVMAFFSAMRSFAETLQQRGHLVEYLTLDDPENQQTLAGNIEACIGKYRAENFCYMMPDEYRLDSQLLALSKRLHIKTECCDSEHFLTERQTLKEHFGEKNYRLESFYRQIRKSFDILMVDGKPAGGRWNFDAENRKKLPASHQPPEPLLFSKDLSELHQLLCREKVSTLGSVDPKAFIWPVNRGECLELLEYFVTTCLPHFGDYQDAMTPLYWSLYHSRLSFALNVKLLSPAEVVERAVQQWQNNSDRISIAQIEGFVRQIIGWREYMRGVYWAKMPEFSALNYFGARRSLPDWFWSGDTRMNCLSSTISQSLEYAYAHHIQRLMVTGNFALLAGINPDELDAWYLGIYIDAVQWVEITNTRGMSQFADGGIVGSKPYCSSANYIDKMSWYCRDCHYDKKGRIGDRACPFNSLYWDFHARNRQSLSSNPRIGMVYRTWDRMDKSKQREILKQAAYYLDRLEEL